MSFQIDKRAFTSLSNFSSIIYKNAVLNKEEFPKQEEIIDISYNGKFVGKALYDPKYPLIKLLTKKEEEVDYDFFKSRLLAAKNYRENILNYKNTYRMVYAEADSLPSLIIDKYNNIASMQVSSKIMDEYSDLIFECLFENTDIETLYVQSGKKGSEVKTKIFGDKSQIETVIFEGNAKFMVNMKGHKTGFFLDQRENRIDLENYVKKGDKVLDICSYTGGFSVHAGIRGAEVTAIDISEKASIQAKENMELNDIKNYNFLTGNAFDLMKEMIKNNDVYDVVILDPPAFTDSSKDLKNALNAYNAMNYLGLKLAKRMLVTCSCSHHVDRESFKNTVVSSSIRAKKEIRQIGPYRTQAPDHVITMANKDLEYLKCLFFNLVTQ
ncbi:methyltransferase related protein [Methanococcus vannielii SB]|uniref:Methyltransferase related protein n=1 Tax=Methanococcus vannielii (strain ATCC 35089 / DSM 1224 / JCM 13029 / OCM 148 / SB) TaxID=406327 RepID=A6UPV1_METVS|nr:class I SAM-dependent rRNA methyltransferase [Methanococcus vannielii]ABR54523.1 methyltransferase related protein [Methanococcus vannielii SB]